MYQKCENISKKSNLIAEDVLSDFFRANRQDVIEMSFLEYTAEGNIKELQDESYETGIQDTTNLFSWLKDNNRQDDIFKALDDKDFLSKLIQ